MASSTCDGRRSAGALVGAVLVLLASAQMARAASGPAAGGAGTKDAAEAKLVEGVELLKTHSYRQALERFEEAYALLPSSLIFYDIGLAHLGLGDAPRALESFDRFLAEAPDAPADKRRRAERYRDELRAQVSVVTLEANVAAADLIVDGLALGRVSLPRNLYLAPGSHEVIARAGGTQQPTTISCLGGQTLTFSLRLAPPPAPVILDAPKGPSPVSRPVSPLGVPVTQAPHPTGAVEIAQSSPPHARDSWARPAALAAAAAGVVSISVGVALGLAARSDANEVTGESQNGRTFTPSAESAGFRDQGLETVFLAVGAVAVAAGVSLYAWARHHQGGQPTAEAAP
jgi:hypothetical protein